VRREVLKRLHRAFAQDGIEFATGVITVQHAGAMTLPSAQSAAAASASRTEPAVAGASS
jgi:hypothetical protein